MRWTNCRRVKVQTEIVEGPREEALLVRGWVGVEDGVMHFRPTRGSDGYAVYDSEASAKRHTGCPDAMQVAIRLVPGG